MATLRGRAGSCNILPMRRRFFVDRFESTRAVLKGEPAHHLSRVLRAQPGQVYELSDGSAVWLGRIEQVSRDAVHFALVEQMALPAPGPQISLLLSIVKFDRFEWCLEKATELGVAEIIPLAAARSDRPLIAAAAKRGARWQRILMESAQQARRLSPPGLRAVMNTRDALAGAGLDCTPPGANILLSEREDAPPLRAVLQGKRVGAAKLAIGPEGGWTDDELASARGAGFVAASLGRNILRTETAVIAALAVLNFALAE